MWFVLGSLVAFGCDDVGGAATEAKQAVLELEFGAAQAALDKASAGLSCGSSAKPGELGLMWLVQGTLASFNGDDAAAQAPYAAASRVAPDLWVLDFGPGPQAVYQNARAEPAGVGTLQVTDLPNGYWLAIDGEQAESPLGITAGLHVVQAGPTRDAIAFGKILNVTDGAKLMVETGLSAGTAPSAPKPVTKPDAIATVDPSPSTERLSRGGLSLVVAIGGGAAFGEAWERETAAGDRVTEPAIKVLIPLELGARIDLGAGWLRAMGGGSQMLTGSLLYVSGTEIKKASTALQFHLSGGVRVGALRLGGLAGVALPGRQVLRAVGSYTLFKGIEAELRLGANRVHDRGLEPAASVLLAITPRISTL